MRKPTRLIGAIWMAFCAALLIAAVRAPSQSLASDWAEVYRTAFIALTGSRDGQFLLVICLGSVGYLIWRWGSSRVE